MTSLEVELTNKDDEGPHLTIRILYPPPDDNHPYTGTPLLLSLLQRSLMHCSPLQREVIDEAVEVNIPISIEVFRR